MAPSVQTTFDGAAARSLEGVRVHAASDLPRRHGARAFATHDAVTLDGPMPSMKSIGGRFLLAHELAHVAQLRNAGRRGTEGTAPDAAAEREADHAAVRFAFGLRPHAVTHRPAPGALLASPLSKEISKQWLLGTDKADVFDALRAQSPVRDPDLDAVFAGIFTPGSDDLWLAQTIARNGPEPLWPTTDLNERRRRQRDHAWAPEPGGIHATLMTTAGGRAVAAYFFAGTSDERALVIAGVHGSEQGGIEVAEMLVQTLKRAPVRPYYTTIVVPSLFPDNAAKRLREGKTETNRNFPAPGQSLDAALPGLPVLPENVALMRLVERFHPSRIASVHGSTDAKIAGIFSDPHTTAKGAGTQDVADAATRTAADKALAIAMARDMKGRGFARGVQGNRLDAATPNTGWQGGVPGGTSLGGWGPRAIAEGAAGDRPAMTVITIETDTNARSTDLRGQAATNRALELAGYRDVIQQLFLGPP